MSCMLLGIQCLFCYGCTIAVHPRLHLSRRDTEQFDVCERSAVQLLHRQIAFALETQVSVQSQLCLKQNLKLET